MNPFYNTQTILNEEIPIFSRKYRYLCSKQSGSLKWQNKVESIEVRWFPYRYLPILTNNLIY